jgi:hypothetical protein
VITGFNTDIEHDGVVYHVQTEDKGLSSPLILSLVYSGGAILAAKRQRYEDLIEAGFNEEVLTQRLQRQHRLICAAITAGRIEELKRMGAKIPEVVATDAIIAEIEAEIELAPEQPVNRDTAPLKLPAALKTDEAQASAYTVHDSRREAPDGEVVKEESVLTLVILDDGEYYAGESVTIRVRLDKRTGATLKPLSGVPLMFKVLGTAFRPQIYAVRTERDGTAEVAAVMPMFTSGRAAVVVRAVVKDETIEVRRVVHPAE